MYILQWWAHRCGWIGNQHERSIGICLGILLISTSLPQIPKLCLGRYSTSKSRGLFDARGIKIEINECTRKSSKHSIDDENFFIDQMMEILIGKSTYIRYDTCYVVYFWILTIL